MSIKETWIEHIEQLQNSLCEALEVCDGKAKFIEDQWQRKGRRRWQDKSYQQWKCF